MAQSSKIVKACLASCRLHYMKKTLQAEDVSSPAYAFLDETDSAPMTVREDNAPVPESTPPKSAILDGFVTAIKWIFLFLPGTAAIHLLMVGFSLMLFYDIWSLEMMAGALGVLVVSSFMIMLGIGKLTDLRYLRVVAGIFAAGALASVVYGILAVFIPGDFFGFYARLTLPLTLLIGYLVKRHTDGLPGID